MNRIIAVLAVSLVVIGAAAIAATGTVTVSRLGDRYAQRVRIDWTSDQATGTVRDTLGLDGYLERAIFVPDNDGASTPTANYDVTIDDVGEFDWLSNSGLDRSATSVEEEMFFPATGSSATTGTQRYNVGPLDLKVDNASTSPSTASGTIYLFMRK